MSEDEIIEVSIKFTGEFKITQSGLTKEQAIKDTLVEWGIAADTFAAMDYVEITEVSEPEVI